MSSNKPGKSKLNSYIKFSGLAFQMAATITAFVFIGKFADNYFDNNKPVLTAVCSVVGVLGALYNLIRSVQKMKKNE